MQASFIVLKHLKQLNISVWLENGNVRLSVPEATLPTDIRSEFERERSRIASVLRMIETPVHPAVRCEVDEASHAEELSFAQERLWFLDQLEGQHAAYNMPAALEIRGALDVAALYGSFGEILRRHESLRTTIQVEDGRPVRVVSGTVGDDIPLTSLEGDEESSETELWNVARTEFERPFELAKGPLVRAKLLRLRPDRHVLLLTVHHIVFDGWSMGILLRELAEVYEAFSEAKPSPLPPVSIQYGDFVRWQRQWLTGDLLDEQLTYWKRALSGAPPLLGVIPDHPRPSIQTFRGKTVRFTLDRVLTEQVKELAHQEGVTLFMILLTGFAALLSRYGNQKDVVIGTPIANRNRPEIESIIGFFVNTLALRIDLTGEPTVRELLRRVREVTLGGYDHQDVPFAKVVEALQPERSLSHAPLLQATFVLQNIPLPELRLRSVHLRLMDVDNGTAKFDLTLTMEETDDGLKGAWEFNTDLFEETTIRRMMGHYQTLLLGMVADPDHVVNTLSLLSASERKQILVDWNDTKVAYPEGKTLHGLFVEQAARTPDAVAVVFEEKSLTYRELDIRSNQLANWLRSVGVGPEQLVGICVERSLEMVVGLLGILKAGGAYVPLDPEYPPDRIRFMLEDAAAPVLVTQERFREGLLVSEQTAVLRLDTDWEQVNHCCGEAPTDTTHPDNLAYVIYTSGSTGRPKGVMISHRSICNQLHWVQNTFGLTHRDALLQKTPFSFDASVKEFFPPLVTGAKLVLALPGGHKDGAYLVRTIQNHGITILQVVPSQLRILVDTPDFEACSTLRHLFCAGEVLSEELARRCQEAVGNILHNLYGPTEAAVDVSHWPYAVRGAEALVPIGYPIANTRLLVLDEYLEPVPVGVSGELFIGGVNLARGYLNRQALTADRFVPDPFGSDGARLYRTGDLVRLRENGAIDFLGRTDHQVKLRGIRIELGEIEAALTSDLAIREAAVMMVEPKLHDHRLVAYVSPDYTSPPVQAQIQALAKERTSEWQVFYDHLYGTSIDKVSSPQDNQYVGWNSSYTGLPLPLSEMREWTDSTVERILAMQPRRVLEIGCGTGLLALRIAQHCESYTGTDFSEDALRRCREYAASHPDLLERMNLLKIDADEIALSDRFDVIVLNSCIQYFPDVSYLLRTLHAVFRVLAPDGSVFLGDIRNLALLREFHASVQVARVQSNITAREMRQGLERALASERELLLHPDFFHALKQLLPQITSISRQLKRGRCSNEITKFRYDVVLNTRRNSPVATDSPTLDWRKNDLSVDALRQYLHDQRPQSVTVTNIPNSRIAEETELLNWLNAAADSDSLQRFYTTRDGRAPVGPEDLSDVADACSYNATADWYCVNDRMDSFQVTFTHKDSGLSTEARPIVEASSYNCELLASDPLVVRLAQSVLPGLRKHLRENLPEYMVPSAIMVLRELPRLPNGKIDRGQLPTILIADRGRLDHTPDDSNPYEREVFDVWARLLDVEGIGYEDNFFDLGGHSLLAVQVRNELENRFKTAIPIVALFQHPTIRALAAYLRDGSSSAAPQPAMDSVLEGRARARSRQGSLRAKRLGLP